ncbi:YigZ family protein [Alicyclobacillus sp. ALC3]|uniref:YigZ family protein n=1 Tax=Alicyclobacillus sp. ALC3 TaxID=2796143 RepID=UPI002379AA7F|nr:YigZ family protein [Alicyclobacillus sp. ALC3]WDL99476.1 YigZ family protein [Alicyclobacillus sp. ALC3]
MFEDKGVAEVVIRKSRFIGHLLPVTSVAQADAALSALREAHKTASHNCFAYTIGLDGTPVERFSDDGEPSGTAGRPMLELLRRRDIHNTLVVVTRYFGGTLLGASGLVHAYQDASQAAMEATTALTCVRMRKVRVSCDYATFGKLEYAYAQAEYLVGEKTFTEDVGMDLTVTEEEAERLSKMTADLSSGQARIEMDDVAWFGRRPDGSVVRL